jgi:hypothetical protein
LFALDRAGINRTWRADCKRSDRAAKISVLIILKWQVHAPFTVTATPTQLENSIAAKSGAVKSTARLALFAAIAVAGSIVSLSSSGATATATASAVIVAPIGIANTSNLSFGNFDPSTIGTITVDTAGNRSASGVKLAGGTPSAAAFTISGQPGLSYSIDYTGTSTTLRNGADSLQLTIVTDLGGAATSAGAPVASGTLGGGPSTLRIGGVLSVSSPGNSPGTYTGTIAAAVQYQ